MVPIAEFALRSNLSPGAEEASRSHLLYRNHETGLLVEGVVLEQQFTCSHGYLLLTTENSPYEEGLHIYLLDRKAGVLDYLQLSHPYAAGILCNVEVVDAGQLQFSFFGSDRWRLTVLNSPRYKIPSSPFSPVKRRMRSLFSRHYLELARVSET